ncbi:MAG: UbiA family prenyltransferase [Ardenticatenaceae bacterium]|nr:UbiA family prenyltransferase [Ardenticatenaceae bacterium]
MKLRDWFRFGHVAIFGYTAVLPLMGAGTSAGSLNGWQVAGLLATAVSYHLFAYLLNDLIDLPLDKTQPSRQNYPLVNGLAKEQQVRIWVILQLPILLILWWILGGNGWALLCLAWAVGGMTLYNLVGKRSPLPPLTDLVQGSSWAAFLLFGAFAVDQPTPQTWVAAGFIIVYILLVNGINGSLRDLANDFAFGARTTAIWLGARPFPPDQFTIPNHLRIYAFFWQFTLGLLAPLLPVVDKFPLSADENIGFWQRLLFIIFVTQCYVSLWLSTRQSGSNNQREPAYMANNIWNLTLLLTAVLPLADLLIRWAIILVFALPLLTSDWLAEKYSQSSVLTPES